MPSIAALTLALLIVGARGFCRLNCRFEYFAIAAWIVGAQVAVLVISLLFWLSQV